MLKLVRGNAPRPRLIGVAIRDGQNRITRLLQPALTVVREPGKPPRVEWAQAPTTGDAA